MIHLVAGLHRTGTSMMMRALCGSCDLKKVAPLWDAAMDASIKSRAVDPTYDPNPNGYWQTDPNKVTRTGVLGTWIQNYDGKLFKVHPLDLVYLEPGAYRICFMKRNLEEMQISYMRAFGHKEDEYTLAVADSVERALGTRSDVKLTVLDYVATVTDPAPTFKQLKKDGWPIDEKKAVTFIDPALYRNRL